MKKTNILLSVLSIIILVLLVALFSTKKASSCSSNSTNSAIIKSKDKTIENLKLKIATSHKKAKSNSLVNITVDDLSYDLNKKYSNVSTRVKKEIIKTIVEVSKKRDINPLILYSLIYVESSFRFWIEHPKTLITIGKKKKYIRAVGLGGIVWEWYKDDLQKSGIAETRSDLFNPSINIRAIGLVYEKLRKRSILKGSKNSDESAMLRYFGGNHKWYFEKINKKTSNLVMYSICRRKKNNETK